MINGYITGYLEFLYANEYDKEIILRTDYDFNIYIKLGDKLFNKYYKEIRKNDMHNKISRFLVNGTIIKKLKDKHSIDFIGYLDYLDKLKKKGLLGNNHNLKYHDLCLDVETIYLLEGDNRNISLNKFTYEAAINNDKKIAYDIDKHQYIHECVISVDSFFVDVLAVLEEDHDVNYKYGTKFNGVGRIEQWFGKFIFNLEADYSINRNTDYRMKRDI